MMGGFSLFDRGAEGMKSIFKLLAPAAVAGLVACASSPDGGLKEAQQPSASLAGDAEEAQKLNARLVELYQQGEYAEAAKLGHRLLTIAERTFGSEHPNMATVLDNLAQLHHAMGGYAQAEPLYRRALAIRERTLGTEHPDTAISLNNLAELHRAMGDHAQALPLHRRALAIRERALGAEHPHTALSLSNLAALHQAMGDYAQAEPLHRRALAIREKVFGPEHPDTAASLNNLAWLHDAMGDYAQAAALYRRALAISEKVLGPVHPDTAISLNNLALLHQAMGDYAQALPLLRRALAISEKVLGPVHPDTAISLNNLALLHQAMGDHAQALPLHRRALAISERALGPEHPDTAASLNNLALLHRAMGDHAQALPLHQRALAISERALGTEHPDTAASLNNLAELHQAMGDHAQAAPLHRRALAISEKVLGPEHPDTANSLNNLAVLQGTANQNDEAYALFLRGLEVQNRAIANVFQIATEEQKLKFVQASSWGYEGLLSLIHRKFPADPEKVRAGLDAALSRKGIVFDAQARQNEVIAGSLDPATKTLWDALAGKRAALAKLLQDGFGQIKPEAYRKRFDALQEDIGQLETALAAKSGLAAAEIAQRKATADTLAARLAQDAALVEFVRIRDQDWAKGKWSDAERYLAFVLHPDRRVELLDLGEAKSLDEKANALLKTFARIPANAAQTEAATAAARELHDLVWRPLAAKLGAAKRVTVSPDGAFNLVPFAALMAPDERFLVESLEFSYVTSGRDLLRAQGIAPESDLFLAANPDYGLSAKSAARKPDAPAHGKMRSRDFDMEFPPLPGTAMEAERVPGLLPGARKNVVTGASATETAVLAIKRPNVLHLTTHGFFLQDQPEPKPQAASRPGGFGPAAGLAEELRESLGALGLGLRRGQSRGAGARRRRRAVDRAGGDGHGFARNAAGHAIRLRDGGGRVAKRGRRVRIAARLRLIRGGAFADEPVAGGRSNHGGANAGVLPRVRPRDAGLASLARGAVANDREAAGTTGFRPARAVGAVHHARRAGELTQVARMQR
jgi:tetratricopeptide (TPR) repeat protein